MKNITKEIDIFLDYFKAGLPALGATNRPTEERKPIQKLIDVYSRLRDYALITSQ